jgi:hypothetical protein
MREGSGDSVNANGKQKKSAPWLYAGIAMGVLFLVVGCVLANGAISHLPMPESPSDESALGWLCMGTTLCAVLAGLSVVLGIVLPLPAPSGMCTKCGYSLAGLAADAPCPECGKRS